MFDAAFERVRARLSDRRWAYQALFLAAEPGRGSVRWWSLAWWRGDPGRLTPAAEIVLRDLARYCYANKPTLKVSQVTQQSDAVAMAFAEGRRDVYNRIKAMCNLTQDQIDQIAHTRSNDV